MTGASGFLGSHIASQLLDAGHILKASFRTATKADLFSKAFPDKSIETCIIPDITAAGAYDGQIDGVDFVVHCASPYNLAFDDIQRDLIDPAVKGTTEIMNAALKTRNVKRVVITSSFAAVLDPAKSPRTGYTYTGQGICSFVKSSANILLLVEQDWNPVTPEKALENKVFGYQASKTFAERIAWDMVTANKPNCALSLVTICPPMIFGPPHPASGIGFSNLNESSAQLVTAARDPKPSETRLPMFVDVRDVAAIHVASLNNELVPSSERFLVSAGKFTWAAIRELSTRGEVTDDSMKPSEMFYSISAKKVEDMLGISWRPLETTVDDCLRSLEKKCNKGSEILVTDTAKM